MDRVITELSGPWGMAMLLLQAALVLWAISGLIFAALAPASAYSIEGKWPKPAWIGICAVAALMFAIRPLGFLSLIAMVAVGVFFADVRPAVGGRRR